MNQDITPPSYQSDGAAPTAAAAPTPTAEAAPATQPTGQVIPLQSGPKRGKGKVVLLVLLILVLLAAIGGVYYWQQGKYDTLATAKTTADKQIMSLETQLKAKSAATKPAATAAPAATTPNYNVVTGNVTTQATTTASVAALYKPGTIEEVWLEYGTTPDKLTTATTHITQGLGAGDASTYAQQVFKLTGLTAGQNYFYHVAAKAKGATIYSGTASFTAVK